LCNEDSGAARPGNHTIALHRDPTHLQIEQSGIDLAPRRAPSPITRGAGKLKLARSNP
jgi:hypothetical protein